MEWTKIRCAHFLWSTLSDSQLGQLAKILSLVATLERIPIDKEFRKICTKTQVERLSNYFSLQGKSLKFIMDKVLEDVKKVEHKRGLSRSTSKTYNDKKKTVDTSIDTIDKTREEKIRLEKRREENSMYETQIINLLTQFSLPIKTLINEYIEIAEKENKSGKILVSKRARLINEIYNIEMKCENKEWFQEALRITVRNQVPNANYIKSVYKGLGKKKDNMFNTIAENNKKEWDEGVRKGEELYRKSQADSKSIQQK